MQKWASTAYEVTLLLNQFDHFEIGPPPASQIQISAPRNFQRKAHVGIDPNGGFAVEELPEEWKRLLKQAGITEKEAQDPEVTKLVMGVVAEHVPGAKENAQNRTKETLEVSSAPPPPPPPGAKKATPPQATQSAIGSIEMGTAKPQIAPPPPPIGGDAIHKPTKPAPNPPHHDEKPESDVLQSAPPEKEAKTSGPAHADITSQIASAKLHHHDDTQQQGAKAQLSSKPSLLEEIKLGKKLKPVQPQDADLSKLNTQQFDGLASVLSKAINSRRQFLKEQDSDDDADWDKD